MYLCRAYLSSTQIGLSLTLTPSRKGFYAYLSSIQTFVGEVQTDKDRTFETALCISLCYETSVQENSECELTLLFPTGGV